MRVEIVQVPTETAEDILARLEQNIKFPRALLPHPVDVPFHVPLSVASRDDRHLGLQKLRKGLLPLVGTGRMSETRVEEHEAVQVRIERLEVLRLVHGVEVINVGRDLHLSAQAILDDPPEGILRGALREREFRIPVGHTLGPDEDQMYEGSREDVAELEPDVTGQ